jgi:hypothetical protein
MLVHCLSHAWNLLVRWQGWFHRLALIVIRLRREVLMTEVANPAE